MTILFVTPDKVNPQCGGISRVTYTLAEGLNDIGIRCGSVYVRQESSCHSDSNIFYCSILLKNEDKTNQWNELINTQKVDFIIVQGGSSLLNQELKYIREAIDSQTRPLQLFYVFHSMPGYELYFLDWSFLVRKIFSKDWIKYLKQLFIQMMMLVNKSFLQKRLYKKYQIPCKYADKIILLSEAYIEDYNLLTQGKNRFKYVAIPNLLTYHSVNNNLSNKEKEVLIVARMDEQSKRIKLALRIWAMIPEELLKIGWKLTIVGDGEDLQFYKNFVHINKIKNVSFEGQQDPLPYYQSASIFMMTSAFVCQSCMIVLKLSMISWKMRKMELLYKMVI